MTAVVVDIIFTPTCLDEKLQDFKRVLLDSEQKNDSQVAFQVFKELLIASLNELRSAQGLLQDYFQPSLVGAFVERADYCSGVFKNF